MDNTSPLLPSIPKWSVKYPRYKRWHTCLTNRGGQSHLSIMTFHPAFKALKLLKPQNHLTIHQCELLNLTKSMTVDAIMSQFTFRYREQVNKYKLRFTYSWTSGVTNSHVSNKCALLSVKWTKLSFLPYCSCRLVCFFSFSSTEQRKTTETKRYSSNRTTAGREEKEQVPCSEFYQDFHR